MGHRLVRAALFLVFLLLYLFIGRSLAATGVFTHEDSIFQSDTWRATNDATEPDADHYRTKVHPLFVLFFNPLGSPLRKATGSSILVAVAFVACAGALFVVISHIFFIALGLDSIAALALSCLLGFSTSHLIFGSIPDTFIFTALSFAVGCWLALKRSGSLPFAVPACVFSLGMATTNIGPAALLFASGAQREGGWRGMIKKSVALVLAVLLIAVGLSLFQKRLYPSSNLFFVRNSFREDVDYMFVPHARAEATARALALLRHLTVFTLVAPEPHIWTPQGMTVPWVSFQSQTLADLHGVGRAAFGLLLVAYALALYGIVRGRLWKEPLVYGLLLGIGFLSLLHYFYGDDFFLYSCSWVVLVVGLLAWGLLGLSRAAPRWMRAVDGALVLLTLLAAANNVRFVLSLIDLYQGTAGLIG